MKRLGLPVAAVLLAGPLCGIAATASAAPVASASTAAGAAAAPAASGVCATSPGFSGGFSRCTGALWATMSCDYGSNFNGGNGPWNVVAADNDCITRVWLHQDAWNGSNWGTGWTYCISPGDGIGSPDSIPALYQHPQNIYISENSSPC